MLCLQPISFVAVRNNTAFCLVLYWAVDVTWELLAAFPNKMYRQLGLYTQRDAQRHQEVHKLLEVSKQSEVHKHQKYRQCGMHKQ